MLTVAYLANRFPSPVEPYVVEEIGELRKRGVRVTAGSVREPTPEEVLVAGNSPDITLFPLRAVVLLQALWLCLRRWPRVSDLLWRVLCRGRESPVQRMKALLHTWLGACYAILLREHRVDHIHVHHGYFGSWIAMVAARLLDIGFSMTLHGSDLLLHGSYLDVKLELCSFCLTVSEYNRRFILEQYPEVEPQKVVVSRLGVEVEDHLNFLPRAAERPRAVLNLLSVGRLHAVKDHAFLIRACAQLHATDAQFECAIAGEGPERKNLETLIRRYGLEDRVTLLGHVPREQAASLYDRADVVVLTSRSEGIPLVLMEAMARGKIVLAPAITGIPELVVPGQTGFLYQPGSMGDFVARLLLIHSLMHASGRRAEGHGGGLSANQVSLESVVGDQLDWMRHAARVQIRHNFNRSKNLRSFANTFLQRIFPQAGSLLHENPVLQQVQLPLQRHRSLPVRADEPDAVAGPRSGAVFDV